MLRLNYTNDKRTYAVAGLASLLVLSIIYLVFGALGVGSAPISGQSHNACYGCHDGSIAGAANIVADFEKTSHHPYSSSDSTATCGSCHNEDGIKDASGTVYPKLLESLNASGVPAYRGNEFCGSCHGVGSPQIGGDHLTAFAGTKHDTETTGTGSGTNIKCVSCHNQHGSNIKPMIRETINGDNPTGDDNSVCLSCHTAALGIFAGEADYLATPHGSDSDVRVKWPVASEVGLAVGGPQPGNCTNCHNPHGKADGGGVIPKYALRREENLCYGAGLGCHAGANSVNNLNIKAKFTAGAGHKTRHDITDADQAVTGAKVECMNCHNTHTNNAGFKNADPDNLAINFETEVNDALLNGKIVLQPASDGIDTYIDESFPFSNYGDNPTMYVGWIGGLANKRLRSLIKFDVGKIPADATVTAVTLSLPQSKTGLNSSPINISLYKNVTGWGESTTTFMSAPGFSGTPVASASSLLTYGYLNFSGSLLKDLVQGWVDGSTDNYGLTVRAPGVEGIPGSSNSFREFLSSDQPNRTPPGTKIVERPKLIVDFSSSSIAKKMDVVGFCGKCHDGNPPAGVVFPTSTRQIEPNYSSLVNGDTHGANTGPAQNPNSINAGINGPYFFGVGKLPCSDCHDPHGSKNAYALREAVNGRTELSVPLSITPSNYTRVQKFCGACHTATHAPSPNCFSCHFHGANADANQSTIF